MKFETRKQKRRVSEFLTSLLLGIKPALTQANQEYVDIALRIISDTEIENEQDNKETK